MIKFRLMWNLIILELLFYKKEYAVASHWKVAL